MLLLLRAVFILGFGLTGVWALVRGLPQAARHQRPLAYGLGVVLMGLSLIVWPPVLVALRNADLEMVWIPVLFAPLFTFGAGYRLARRADWPFWLR